MKRLALILAALAASVAHAQETYTITNLSEAFYAKITLEQPSEVFSKGNITIIDTKTDKALIKIESDDLALSLHDGKALANIKELPYGEQSVVMYEDFNFDGNKDLAIEDGQNSCYHGPSFQIYLADKGRFTLSPAFTRLAQEYCGMFDVDAENKQLHTMTKSGCCWHQYSIFTVKDNQPQAISIVEDDASTPPFFISTEEKWDGKKMVKTTTKSFDALDNPDAVVFSFQVAKNAKQVVLLNNGNDKLIYALLTKDGTVEFSYPATPDDPKAQFTLNNSPRRTLTFGNKTATYSLYEDPANHRVGITIQVDGKTYDWQGADNTQHGSLDFSQTAYGNVTGG